jgi:hypothetical protein
LHYYNYNTRNYSAASHNADGSDMEAAERQSNHVQILVLFDIKIRFGLTFVKIRKYTSLSLTG